MHKEVKVVDCRTMFRLHALDLPQRDRPAPHWMLLRGSGCRRPLADLARAYGRLRRAGADPLAGRPITGAAVISCLGLDERDEPQGVWEHIKFTASLLVAATREGVQIERELAYMAQQQRNQL